MTLTAKELDEQTGKLVDARKVVGATKSQFEAAGDVIESKASGSNIAKYQLGDMTSTVYPVGGGMEDWAYAAGWDFDKDAAFNKCEPKAEPSLEDSFYEPADNVKCAVYLVETDNKKDPSELTYGARTIVKHVDGPIGCVRSRTHQPRR